MGVGPVVEARQAVAADRHAAGAAVARQHEGTRNVGHPCACVFEVRARQPRYRASYEPRVRLHMYIMGGHISWW